MQNMYSVNEKLLTLQCSQIPRCSVFQVTEISWGMKSSVLEILFFHLWIYRTMNVFSSHIFGRSVLRFHILHFTSGAMPTTQLSWLMNFCHREVVSKIVDIQENVFLNDPSFSVAISNLSLSNEVIAGVTSSILRNSPNNWLCLWTYFLSKHELEVLYGQSMHIFK